MDVLTWLLCVFFIYFVQGVLRNDRTPLNTPYTPQLMKLHLKRHEEYDERDEYDERPGKQLVSTVKSKIVLVVQPVHKIRCVLSQRSTILRVRGW